MVIVMGRIPPGAGASVVGSATAFGLFIAQALRYRDNTVQQTTSACSTISGTRPFRRKRSWRFPGSRYTTTDGSNSRRKPCPDDRQAPSRRGDALLAPTALAPDYLTAAGELLPNAA